MRASFSKKMLISQNKVKHNSLKRDNRYVTGEKMLITFAPAENQTLAARVGNQTLPCCLYGSQLVQ